MKWTPGRVALFVGVGVLLFWFAWFAFGLSRQGGLETAGQFGDMFGSLNALFTAAAVIGVAYTMVKQKEEVEIAQRAADVAKQEADDAHRTEMIRRFENTFFELLRLLNGIVSTFEQYDMSVIGPPPEFATGRRALKLLCSNMMLFLRRDDEQRMTTHEEIRDGFHGWYSSCSDDIAHYYRMLFRILRHIDSADSAVDKMRYVRILCDQLSNPELALICYYCFSDDGQELKRLVEKYAMLRHAPVVVLRHKEAKNFFHFAAYREYDRLINSNYGSDYSSP